MLLRNKTDGVLVWDGGRLEPGEAADVEMSAEYVEAGVAADVLEVLPVPDLADAVK